MDGRATPTGSNSPTPEKSRSPIEPRRDAIRILPIQPASPAVSNFTSSAMGSPLSLDTILMSQPHVGVRDGSDTPSSTVVEFGDISNGIPSATDLIRAFSQPRRRSRSASKAESKDGRQDRRRSKSRGAPQSAHVEKERSMSRHRAVSKTRESNEARTRSAERSTDAETGLANDRVAMFLQSMAPKVPNPNDQDKVLKMENRGLYQRVAALQCVERELLAETQVLSRQLAADRQHHNARRQHYRDELRKKEVQVRALEAKIRLLEGTLAPKLDPLLADDEIAAWFQNHDTAWHTWAEEYGHRDPERLTTGLHPMQLSELYEGVCDFVQFTDEGKLPLDLWTGGIDAVRTLLQGMLTHFICNEAFATPFWVFDATSIGVLESPATLPSMKGSLTPAFRADFGLFSDISPMRPNMATPGSPHYPPTLITSMIPPLGGASSSLGLPGRREVDHLYDMLSRAQPEYSDLSPHEWRAQLLRLLAEGGMSSVNTAGCGRNDARRTLIESRLNYARKLKDKFLGSSARFLLDEQETGGIEKLEQSLSTLIDSALRFSCQLWSRDTPIRVHGWKELGGKRFYSTNDLTSLCQAQSTTPCSSPDDEMALSPQSAISTTPSDIISDPHEGRPVLMVVQPAIETIRVRGDDNEPPPKLWLRARVLVATSQRAPAPSPITITPMLSLAPSTGRSQIETPSEATRDPESPSTPKGDGRTPLKLEIPYKDSPYLPSVAFSATGAPNGEGKVGEGKVEIEDDGMSIPMTA